MIEKACLWQGAARTRRRSEFERRAAKDGAQPQRAGSGLQERHGARWRRVARPGASRRAQAREAAENFVCEPPCTYAKERCAAKHGKAEASQSPREEAEGFGRQESDAEKVPRSDHTMVGPDGTAGRQALAQRQAELQRRLAGLVAGRRSSSPQKVVPDQPKSLRETS